jgi:hypothetical protein
MVSKEISKVSVNAIHSVERIGKHLWFYNYAHGKKHTEIIRAQLPFCMLPLTGIKRVDVSKFFDKYNTDFYYSDSKRPQRVEWYFEERIVYTYGPTVYNEWRAETEAEIKKVLDIVGSTEELK